MDLLHIKGADQLIIPPYENTQIGHWKIDVFTELGNIWKLSLTFHSRLRVNLLKNMYLNVH